jgi:hypothetical protein
MSITAPSTQVEWTNSIFDLNRGVIDGEVAKTLLWPSAIIPSISAIYPSVGLLFGGRGSL